MKKLLPLLFVLTPFLMPAQTAYSDSLLAPGAPDSAPPITSSEKLKLDLARSIQPRVFIGFLFVAGIQEARNTPEQWGRKWSGFGKRYGTDLAVNGIRNGISAPVDVLLHQDPRFFRSSKTSTGGRVRDAVSQVIIAHTDSGGRAFAVGPVLGAYGATQLGTLWLPSRQRSVGDGLIYGSLLLAADAGRNLFREFWPDLKHKMQKH